MLARLSRALFSTPSQIHILYGCTEDLGGQDSSWTCFPASHMFPRQRDLPVHNTLQSAVLNSKSYRPSQWMHRGFSGQDIAWACSQRPSFLSTLRFSSARNTLESVVLHYKPDTHSLWIHRGFGWTRHCTGLFSTASLLEYVKILKCSQDSGERCSPLQARYTFSMDAQRIWVDKTLHGLVLNGLPS